MCNRSAVAKIKGLAEEGQQADSLARKDATFSASFGYDEQGLVTIDSALAYWEASEAFNLHASRLHLDSFLPDRDLINRVGRLWRRSRLVKQA